MDKKTEQAAKSAATHATTQADLDSSGTASVSPATGFSPTGAPEQTTDIDIEHPAVDNDPRAGTTVNQNRIDFNDPCATGAEAVKRNLDVAAKA